MYLLTKAPDDFLRVTLRSDFFFNLQNFLKFYFMLKNNFEIEIKKKGNLKKKGKNISFGRFETSNMSFLNNCHLDNFEKMSIFWQFFDIQMAICPEGQGARCNSQVPRTDKFGSNLGHIGTKWALSGYF